PSRESPDSRRDSTRPQWGYPAGVKAAVPLRLMIYDRTCTADFPRPAASGRHPLLRRAGELLEGAPWPGLSHSWWVGGVLYSTLGRLDDWRGFASWGAALEWLAEHRGDQA